MLQAIHDIYARHETFLDYLAHDLDDTAVWFNESEFARYHDIRGKKILSIFTANTISKGIKITIDADNKPVGVAQSGGVLYVRAQDVKKEFASGQQLRLDGKLYIVSEAHLIQDQVWRVVLEANNA